MAASEDSRRMMEMLFGVPIPDENEEEPEVTPEQADFEQRIGLQSDTPPVQQAPEIPVQQPMQPTIQRQGRIIGVNQAGVEQRADREFEPLKQITQEQIRTNQRLTQGQREVNQATQAGQQEVAAFEQDQAKQFEAIKAAHQLDAQKRLDEIRVLADKAANFKVDQTAIWNDGGNFQSAAGLISSFIGGFLAPVLGKNDIQGIIDKAVDRDIMTQRLQKDSLNKAVDRAIQFDSLARQNAADESEEFLQKRIFRLNSLKAKVDAQVLAAQDPVIKEQGQLVSLGLAAAAQKDWSNLEQKHFTRAQNEANKQTASLEAARARAHSVAMQKRREAHAKEMFDKKGELAIKKAEAAAAAAGQEGMLHPKSGFVGPDGKPLRIDDEVQRRKVIETGSRVNLAWNTIEAFKEFGNFDKFKGLPKGDQQRMMKQAVAALKIAAAGGKLSNQISDKDLEILEQAAGVNDADSFFRVFGTEKGFKERLTNYQQRLVLEAKTGVSFAGGSFRPVRDQAFIEDQIGTFGGGEELKKQKSRSFVNNGLELGKAITSPERAQAYGDFIADSTSKLKNGEISSSDGRRILDQAVRNNAPEVLIEELKSGIKAAQNSEVEASKSKSFEIKTGRGVFIGSVDPDTDTISFSKKDEQHILAPKNVPTFNQAKKAVEPTQEEKVLKRMGVSSDVYRRFRESSIEKLKTLKDPIRHRLVGIATDLGDQEFLNKLGRLTGVE